MSLLILRVRLVSLHQFFKFANLIILFSTIYCLVANSKHRGVGDLFKRSLMALYLLKILEMTPFFYNGGSDPRNVNLADKVMMGAVILKHLQNLPCNAHELTEIELGVGSGGGAADKRDSAVHEIGAGVFGILRYVGLLSYTYTHTHIYMCLFLDLIIPPEKETFPILFVFQFA